MKLAYLGGPSIYTYYTNYFNKGKFFIKMELVLFKVYNPTRNTPDPFWGWAFLLANHKHRNNFVTIYMHYCESPDPFWGWPNSQ